jgi:regulator of sigma E protease
MSFEWIYFYAIPFMVVLTVVVFVHELGHYLLARWNGVKIDVFSIGFGPEFFGFYDKAGTRWKFSVIPLGGYVKMFSDVDASSRPDTEALKNLTEEEKEFSHHYKSVWQRIQISAAGPLANYIFGILLLTMIYALYGQRVPTDEPVIGYVASGSVAATSGLKIGDKVLSVDNHQVTGFMNLRDFIRTHANVPLDMVIERDGQQVNMTLTPKSVTEGEPDGKKVHAGQLGIGPAVAVVQRGPLEAFGYGCYDAYSLTVTTLASIGRMLIGAQSADGLSGPIGIAKQTGDIATTDLPTFLWFIAFLSINLGFVNLLPVPVLDGGHLLFYFIEAARGRPLSERTQENAFRVGLVLILALFLFTTYKDIESINLFGRIMSIFN